MGEPDARSRSLRRRDGLGGKKIGSDQEAWTAKRTKRARTRAREVEWGSEPRTRESNDAMMLRRGDRTRHCGQHSSRSAAAAATSSCVGRAAHSQRENRRRGAGAFVYTHPREHCGHASCSSTGVVAAACDSRIAHARRLHLSSNHNEKRKKAGPARRRGEPPAQCCQRLAQSTLFLTAWRAEALRN